MEKNKQNVSTLTDGRHLSLHDLSEEIGIDKKDIIMYVKNTTMTVDMLFTKYTVFSREQANQIKSYFKEVEG